MKRLFALGALVSAGLIGGFRLFGRHSPHEVASPGGVVRNLDGEQIHYLDSGSGPAVVLVHGFMGNTFTWRTVIGPLALDHRVIALDLPGFGYSDRRPHRGFGHIAQADRIVTLMDALGIERGTLIGHSMGGGIVQRVAERHPGRVERLVLVASVNGGDAAEIERARRRRGGRGAFAVARLLARWSWFMHAAGRWVMRRTVADPSLITEEVLHGYIDPLLIPGTIEGIEALTRVVLNEPPVNLGAISAPTLVVTGDLDRVVDARAGEGLLTGIADARGAVIAACGHLVPDEQPEALVAAMRTFMAESRLAVLQ